MTGPRSIKMSPQRLEEEGALLGGEVVQLIAGNAMKLSAATGLIVKGHPTLVKQNKLQGPKP